MTDYPQTPSVGKWTVLRPLPLLVLLGAAVAVLAFFPSRPALRVADGSGGTLRRLPLAVGERFSVVFTHSHAKSRVEEVFEATSTEEFRLRETVYEDFGAGLPHEEAPGLAMEFADGRIRLSGYDVAFRELQLRVGRVAEHRIEIQGKTALRLADAAPPGSEVRLSMESVAPWRLWF